MGKLFKKPKIPIGLLGFTEARLKLICKLLVDETWLLDSDGGYEKKSAQLGDIWCIGASRFPSERFAGPR